MIKTAKPIDKNYLVETLKSFDSQILDKKYQKKCETVEQHTHENKDVLDGLNQDTDGNLLYNGNKIESGIKGDNGKSAYEIAKLNGFEGTEKEWLKSLKGEPGKDGKSIKSITKDENNNIIVTFSDNTIQNIGKLTIDVSADFLTDNGFGNLRYVNSKLQYYDITSGNWIDISVIDSNKFMVSLIPQHMKEIIVFFDYNNKYVKIRFSEPTDTIIDGQLLCYVSGVKIIRKLGSEPESEFDGDLILDIKRKDFGAYKNNYYIDNNIESTVENTYYYKFFPYSSNGMINNCTENCVSVTIKETMIYGFRLNQNESNPDNMITYIVDNTNFKSAKMNFDTGEFDYGDWRDVWFIKNLTPCMLKYNGTVDYELNKNDYSKKVTGEDSDVTNISYNGNAMVGIPKVYWKMVDNGDNTCSVYFSDQKVDEDFHCYSHIDNNGNEIDYCYMPIYNGYKDSNNKLRSLSGKTPLTNQTGINEITYAKANNLTSDEIWNTEVYSDRILITLLLLLIGKSTDTQSIFGNGNEQGSVLQTGTMDKSGLFYGTQSSSHGIKVFGIENFWGNIWRRTAGYIYTNNVQKIKMTYSKNDESTCIGYNTTGEGYLEIPNSAISGSNGGYINIMLFDRCGLFPKQVSGSSSMFYTDGCWFENNANTYALFGGNCLADTRVGALSTHIYSTVSTTYMYFGCAISCKPFAPT